MRRIAACSIALAATVAAPAQAKPDKPAKPAAQGKAAKCTPRAVGYNASGTLVSSELTRSAGSDTAERGDDRYSGTVVVDLKKANHRASTGETTFAVVNARVKFSDADGDESADAPKAGDRVKVGGKITRPAKKCDQSASAAAVTVRKVDFKQPKAPS